MTSRNLLNKCSLLSIEKIFNKIKKARFNNYIKMVNPDYVEIAKSDRSSCVFCKRKILKGTPRAVFRGVATQSHPAYPFFACHKCGKLRIQSAIVQINEMEKQLDKLIEENKDKIMLYEL